MRQGIRAASGAALITIVVALQPGHAGATTMVSVEDCGPATPGPDCTTLVLEGDAADSYAEIWPQTFGGPGDHVEVTNFFFDNAIAPKAGSGCTSGTSGSRVYVRCPELITEESRRRVRATLGGGADSFQSFVVNGGGININGGDGIDSLDVYAGSSPATVNHPATLNGGPGGDSLSGDEGIDTLIGGPGNDTLNGRGGADNLDGGTDGDTLEGGTGADTLGGGSGPDVVRGGDQGDVVTGGDGVDRLGGGPGDDALDGGADDDLFEAAADPIADTSGRDTVVGGTGIDGVSYSSQSYALTTIAFNGLADDGNADPGSAASLEQDNIAGDVENATSANGGARSVLIGTDARNELTGLADRNAVNGGGGPDRIVTTCYPNCVSGDDFVDGGPGNDEIRTGDGADTITGGDGSDEIYADNCSSYTCSEPDQIDVVDGVRDDVYCGGGGDVVRADPVDQLLLCANVTIVGGGGPSPGPGPGTNPGGTGGGGGGTPTTPPGTTTRATCVVPKLKKASLTVAKRRLKKAGCVLGKVTRPKSRAARRKRLVVSKHSPAAGKRIPVTRKVAVTLAPRRK